MLFYIFLVFLKYFIKIVKIVKLTIEINITLIIYGKIGLKGAILNHQSKYIRQIANKILIKIASNKRKGENGRKLSSVFLDFASVNNKIIPQIPVDITHKLG